MWIILKVFIEFVTILLLFYVFLATRHVGSQLPQQGLNLHSLHWKASLSHWTTRELWKLCFNISSALGIDFLPECSFFTSGAYV